MDNQGLTQDEVEYINWLKTTLIPDLRESGRDATADDFDKCISIMARLHNVIEK